MNKQRLSSILAAILLRIMGCLALYPIVGWRGCLGLWLLACSIGWNNKSR